MKISILDDGKTHINIYSKSKTELGRKLSNFYRYPLNLRGRVYYSIEAYWYCLRIRQILDEVYKVTPDSLSLETWEDRIISLSTLAGWQAKTTGRELLQQLPPSNLDKPSEEFKTAIKEAIQIKIESIPRLKEELVATGDIPILHYYWYGNDPSNVKIVTPPDVVWINEWISELRSKYQGN